MKDHLNMQIPQSSDILGKWKSTIALAYAAGDDRVRGDMLRPIGGYRDYVRL